MDTHTCIENKLGGTWQQGSLSIEDSFGTQVAVLYREVSLIQR